MERTALYRLYDAQDALLYIGITWQSLPSRMKGHESERSWWQEVHHSTAVWYETREEADQAETDAIRAERPRYNIAKSAAQCRPSAVRCFAPSGVTDGDEAPTELLLIEGWLRGTPVAHIDHLVDLAQQGVTLSVIPDNVGWKTLPASGFTLHEHPGRDSFVVIDLPHEQLQYRQRSTVAAYRKKYEALSQCAVHGDEAVVFVREVAASLRDSS